MSPRHTPVPHCVESCVAVRDVLNRVGDKWSVLVVGTLGSGRQRFNELRRSIEGISQRMLTLTLKALERDGLVIRTVHPTVPPRVEYELTPHGHTLLVPIRALAQWAEANRLAIQHARESYDRRDAHAGRADEKEEQEAAAASPAPRRSAIQKAQSR
jgi:DNA-binding HxlR family transcriptional regulator